MPIGSSGVLVLVLLSAFQAAAPTVQESQAGSAASFQGEPRCAGQPKGAACWRELSDQPGCHVWTSNHEPDAMVTWSIDCVDGMAQGTGTLKLAWDLDQETIETMGRLRNGKRHGRWVMHWADGGVSEGTFSRGTRHGRWVERWVNGTVGEGRYVNGKRHGKWVIRDGHGVVNAGPYLKGKQHGKWVARRDGRVVAEAHFVEGKGQWVDK